MSMRREHLRIARQAGISLVELVMFIVIVSVGLAGILSVMNVTTRHSADPLIRKQALAIAESLLEEIELQAYTANGALPSVAVNGNGKREANNVADYNGFTMSPIRDINGEPISGLEAYGASVDIAPVPLNGVPANDSLKIDVTVTGPSDTRIILTGYRLRYAPNALP